MRVGWWAYSTVSSHDVVDCKKSEYRSAYTAKATIAICGLQDDLRPRSLGLHIRDRVICRPGIERPSSGLALFSHKQLTADCPDGSILKLQRDTTAGRRIYYCDH